MSALPSGFGGKKWFIASVATVAPRSSRRAAGSFFTPWAKAVATRNRDTKTGRVLLIRTLLFLFRGGGWESNRAAAVPPMQNQMFAERSDQRQTLCGPNDGFRIEHSFNFDPLGHLIGMREEARVRSGNVDHPNGAAVDDRIPHAADHRHLRRG